MYLDGSTIVPANDSTDGKENEAVDRDGGSTEDEQKHAPTSDNNQLMPTEKEEKNKKNDEDRWPRLVFTTEIDIKWS